jgi:HEAT repeat protein
VVVVERPTVITKEYTYIPRYDENTAKLFQKLRSKKSELLARLRLGGKEQRISAIRELAGFSFDNKVREALADILLFDPDPELRKEGAKAFGSVKNTAAISALEKAREQDSDKQVRDEAAQAIRNIQRY